MKKYLFGLSAIVLAIAFSAFTKPVKPTTTSLKFRYSVVSPQYTQAEVQSLASWTFDQAASGCSTTANAKPCTFIVTDEKFVHDVSGFGDFVLNDATYMAGSPETGDVLATVVAAVGSNSLYVVDKVNPSQTTTSIENRTL